MSTSDTLVVGAALVDDQVRPTRVLAARRSRPAELAGAWEFPGGKVETGEKPEAALRRELSEELGIDIALGEEIVPPGGDPWGLSENLTMRLWLASVESGTPEPLEEHDELRWLEPANLHTVPWLPADWQMLPYLFRTSHPDTTPESVERLDPGSVFVFGSNAAGHHGAGAARLAAERFGAVDGVGEGLRGQSYAVPSMEGPEALAGAAVRFCAVATQNPGLVFYLTKVGCGIAGYDEAEVAPLFSAAPPNVLRPPGW